MNKTRVLIVDDHPVMRMGMVELLEHEPDMEVCGTASDVNEGMQQIEALRPEVVIVDISLKGGNGIELIEQTKGRHSDIKMLVSSMYDESLFAERVCCAPAQWVSSASRSPGRDALRAAASYCGQVYLSMRMANRLLTAWSVDALPAGSIEGLSNRELEVFELWDKA